MPKLLRYWLIVSALSLNFVRSFIANDRNDFYSLLRIGMKSKTAHWMASSDLELFSVAPMMGHTNRHYRHFYRLLSENSFLYSEMIPSAQIVNAYERLLKFHPSQQNQKSSSSDHPEQIVHAASQLHHYFENYSPSEQYLNLIDSIGEDYANVMMELLYPGTGQNTLQLGGRNPEWLEKASAIGIAFSNNQYDKSSQNSGFTSINLNCGCPSSSVASGRQTGAALMTEPELVAKCCESMSCSIDDITQQVGGSVSLSVKHRLGVAMANEYDATKDRQMGDDEAYSSCSTFAKYAGYAGNVSKLQVHARYAILGLDDVDCNEDGKSDENKSLWTPSQGRNTDTSNASTKVNHKRVQYKAKKQARQATIKNRDVPPLRPNVVNQIADDFPHLQIVTNGGIRSMSDIAKRIGTTGKESIGKANNIIGAMVGRAAINHPCSFAGVDSTLWESPAQKPTRLEVLQRYIAYCEEQEVGMSLNTRTLSPGKLKNWRKKLIAVPFHLFMGEEGNNEFQRRLRKLVSRGDRHPAHQMLQAAMAEIPISTLNKPVDEYVEWDEIEKYDFTKRSGAMQRTIY